jgi:hypothetical protein
MTIRCAARPTASPPTPPSPASSWASKAIPAPSARRRAT